VASSTPAPAFMDKKGEIGGGVGSGHGVASGHFRISTKQQRGSRECPGLPRAWNRTSVPQKCHEKEKV